MKGCRPGFISGFPGRNPLVIRLPFPKSKIAVAALHWEGVGKVPNLPRPAPLEQHLHIFKPHRHPGLAPPRAPAPGRFFSGDGRDLQTLCAD